ncbi:hypothetical protein CRE_09705 [Caenorhabditis remanei]|uniref:Saposin B-type domain-containing protein n=1 Tax=Caenorhabditis remanei TaxID=31234 RepID=E3MX40_CAERE|nr:hypothetical protein CRE_09705 [Caenorhabditis remanei]
MKFILLAAFFLLAVFVTSTDAANTSGICIMCSGMIQIPNNWKDTQQLLSYGCKSLGEAANACSHMVEEADLTASYPRMFPYIIQLKDIGCRKFCQ